MRAVLTWFTILALSGALVAQTATTAQKRAPKKPASAPASAEEVQQLRQAVAAQAQQIQQLTQTVQQVDEARRQAEESLRQALAAASQAQSQANAAASSATEQKDAVGKLQNQMADVQTALTNSAVGTQDEQKRVSTLEGLFGRFRFTGDVRVRYENFFQGVPDGTPSTTFFPPRHRERIRLRFGVEGKLNEDFLGGIFVASGTLTDPTSTNETLTSVFEKKTIGFDRGYIIYNPQAHKWLTLTGGKFAYSWVRTPQTFDSDLNPEGFTEKASFDFHGPVVKNLTLQAMQLLFNEVAGSAVASGMDSFAVGGQVSSKLQIGKRWTATPSFSVLNWRNPDAILQQSGFTVGQTTTNGGGLTSAIPVPGPGPGCQSGVGLPAVPPCAFGPNGITNNTVLGADGKPHFVSGFLYADFILNNQFRTAWERFPINLLLEYEDNLNAVAPSPTRSPQSHTYLADINIGRTANKGDFQLGYAWLRQEQDSVLASFNESDQRAPTNILQHRLYFNYKLARNTVASYTFWFGRTLDDTLPNARRGPGVSVGQIEPFLRRMQFDVVYSF